MVKFATGSPFCVYRSSGSAVRLPMTVMIVSLLMLLFPVLLEVSVPPLDGAGEYTQDYAPTGGPLSHATNPQPHPNGHQSTRPGCLSRPGCTANHPAPSPE